MPTSDDQPPPAAPSRRRFGYTLWLTSIATALLGAALAGVCVPIAGVQAATLLYLSMLVLAMLTVATTYGRGYVRTFAVGAMFPAGMMFLLALFSPPDSPFNPHSFLSDKEPAPEMVLAVAVALGLILLAGGVAAGIRWIVESAERAAPLADVAPGDPAAPRPFQFSLRTMFIVTTVAAMGLGGLCTPTAGVRMATLLYLAILAPTALTATVVYGRGSLRAFAIGALYPAGVTLLLAFAFAIDNQRDVFDVENYTTYEKPSPATVLAAAIVLVLILLAGLVAIGVRWMIESAERRTEVARASHCRADFSPPPHLKAD